MLFMSTEISLGPNAEELIYKHVLHMEHLKFIIYRGENKSTEE